VTEDPATGPMDDGTAAPAPPASAWATGAESVDDRDGTPFAPSEDTVRLSLNGHPPLPEVAEPPVPLAPAQLTFPAQDVPPPPAASQQQAQAQPSYQPHTPYQPQPYLQTLQPQPGRQTQPGQAQPYIQPPQPVQPQPYPAPPGYQAQPLQQAGYIQPPVYAQPPVYGQVGYGQVGYGQPAFPQPAVFAPSPAAPHPAAPPQNNIAPPPSMLAAAADRERAIDVLKAAYGEGRITKDELDQRVHQVAQARTYADLGVVVADLPAGPLGGVSHYPGNLPAPAPYYPPARQTTNGLAIGSLVCALLFPFMSLPAVVLGHIARKQIRERNERGDGLAVAGLVIGWLGIAFYALVFIVAIVSAGGSGGS
jgi:hypothetical protein